MGRVERVYIRLYKRYAREEDALKCREGECLNGSYQRLFTVPVRPEVKAFFAMPRLQGAQRKQNLCHNALKTERGKKYEISFAREARVFTFQTYTFFKGTCIPGKSYTVRA